jgi:hypothetical protein
VVGHLPTGQVSKELNMTETINWPGESGKTYKYWIYEIDTSFDDVPANYVFAKETKPGTFKPVYIGQTSDLSERFDNHHKTPCIRRAAATHIHAHKSSTSEASRKAEENDLIQKWLPSCNG